MSRIRITPLAAQDLAEIWYSIAQDDPVSADRLQERAGKCTQAWQDPICFLQECHRQRLRVAPLYIRSGLETPSKSRANSTCRSVAAARDSRELRISALGSFRIGQLL
jgi:hypothetical protein